MSGGGPGAEIAQNKCDKFVRPKASHIMRSLDHQTPLRTQLLCNLKIIIIIIVIIDIIIIIIFIIIIIINIIFNYSSAYLGEWTNNNRLDPRTQSQRKCFGSA